MLTGGGLARSGGGTVQLNAIEHTVHKWRVFNGQRWRFDRAIRNFVANR